jgi:pSer/pThr/pTyr-binding forkhead associated (FHA) protein
MEPGSARLVQCRSTDERWSFNVPEGVSVSIGRDPARAQVVIPIPALAREHVRFRNKGGVCVVEPVGARGGVFVNAQEHRGTSRPLQSGDVVILLGNALAFIVDPAAAVSAQANADEK